MKAKKERYYIQKEDLLKVVVDYQALVKQCIADGKPAPPQPDKFGRYIIHLCEQLVTRYNFNGYTYKDMMVDDGIEHCVKAILKFDPTKTDNIFNYFTTIAWRAFQLRIIEERKQNAIKHKHYQHTYRLSELDGGQMIVDYSNNEYSNRVIDEYETKHVNKPLTVKKKATKMSTLETCMKDKNNVRQKQDSYGPSDSGRQSKQSAKFNAKRRRS